MKIEDLSPELQEKAFACKTPEALISLAKEEGYELSEDEYASIAGGLDWSCDNQACSVYDPEPRSR